MVVVVEFVNILLSEKLTTFFMFFVKSRFQKKIMQEISFPIGNDKCLQKRQPNERKKSSKNGLPKKLKIDAYRPFPNGNVICWHVAKKPKINSSKAKGVKFCESKH